MYRPEIQKILNPIIECLTKKSGFNADLSSALFMSRLGANFPGIYYFFHLLYGKEENFNEYLKKLIEDLFERFNERDEELKQVDCDREKEPDWFLSEKITGTMLYVDRYSDDLAGFEQKINYLEELGINLVHFMPVLSCPGKNNDGGYAVRDYKKVDKKLGTMQNIRKIAAIFRERKMLLALDLVLNHTSNEHPWAENALAGDPEYQDYYYLFENRDIPDLFEKTLPEVFPGTAPGNFTYLDKINKWVMTVFHHYQWDLNYTNPGVFIEMLNILLFLANQGVDILRLDAVAFLWKRAGTRSQNEPEAHMILQLMKACCQIVAPGVLFIAEAIVSPNEIIKYCGHGDSGHRECDIAYNATFMALLWDALATGNTKVLSKSLLALPVKPHGTTWLNYIRCHDDIGLGFSDEDIVAAGYDPCKHREFLLNYYTGKFEGSDAAGAAFMFNPKTGDARISGSLASLAGLEKAFVQDKQEKINLSIRKIILLHSIIISFGGIPLLYYGDELGTVNDYSYLDRAFQKEDNRWMHRPIINWDKAALRKIKGSVEYRIFTALKTLIGIRKKNPCFADRIPAKMIDTDNTHLLSFFRTDGTSGILCVFNFGRDKQALSENVPAGCGLYHPGKYLDLYTGRKPEIKNGNIILEPRGFLWITG